MYVYNTMIRVHVGGQWSTINVCFVYIGSSSRGQTPGKGREEGGERRSEKKVVVRIIRVRVCRGRWDRWREGGGSLDLWTSRLIPSVNVRPTDDGGGARC